MSEPENKKKTKALLVVSDFFIGEGRRHWDGTINLLEDFTVDQRFVEFLAYYAQAYDEVELVLAGNFFEMLRCRAVPDYPDVLYETYAVEMLRTAMDGHPRVITALRDFMENPSHRVIYLYGESDVGMLWPRAQKELRERISERIVFAGNDYLRDGVFVQHGHQYDVKFEIDIKDPFREVDGVKVLKLPWGAFLHANFVHPLRRFRPQFYRARPMRTYLIWAFLFEARFFVRIIMQFVRMFLKASSRYPGNSWRDFYKLFSQSVDSEDLEGYAELVLGSDTIQKVIFGHAQAPNYRLFQNGKEYFNVGTWTRNLSLDMRSLGAFQKLTYTLVEFRDEPQAKLMQWKGRHQAVEDFI